MVVVVFFEEPLGVAVLLTAMVSLVTVVFIVTVVSIVVVVFAIMVFFETTAFLTALPLDLLGFLDLLAAPLEVAFPGFLVGDFFAIVSWTVETVVSLSYLLCCTERTLE